jgi:hypothetical protein
MGGGLQKQYEWEERETVNVAVVCVTEEKSVITRQSIQNFFELHFGRDPKYYYKTLEELKEEQGLYDGILLYRCKLEDDFDGVCGALNDGGVMLLVIPAQKPGKEDAFYKKKKQIENVVAEQSCKSGTMLRLTGGHVLDTFDNIMVFVRKYEGNKKRKRTPEKEKKESGVPKRNSIDKKVQEIMDMDSEMSINPYLEDGVEIIEDLGEKQISEEIEINFGDPTVSPDIQKWGQNVPPLIQGCGDVIFERLVEIENDLENREPWHFREDLKNDGRYRFGNLYNMENLCYFHSVLQIMRFCFPAKFFKNTPMQGILKDMDELQDKNERYMVTQTIRNKFYQGYGIQQVMGAVEEDPAYIMLAIMEKTPLLVQALLNRESRYKVCFDGGDDAKVSRVSSTDTESFIWGTIACNRDQHGDRNSKTSLLRNMYNYERRPTISNKVDGCSVEAQYFERKIPLGNYMVVQLGTMNRSLNGEVVLGSIKTIEQRVLGWKGRLYELKGVIRFRPFHYWVDIYDGKYIYTYDDTKAVVGKSRRRVWRRNEENENGIFFFYKAIDYYNP